MPRQFDVILNCILINLENISSKFTILISLSVFLQRIKKGDPRSGEPPTHNNYIKLFCKILKSFSGFKCRNNTSSYCQFSSVLEFLSSHIALHEIQMYQSPPSALTTSISALYKLLSIFIAVIPVINSIAFCEFSNSLYICSFLSLSYCA